MRASKQWIMLLAVIGLSLILATPAAAQRRKRGGGGTQTGGTLNTDLTGFITDDFSGAGVCAMCHSMLVDTTGADVSIDSHWRSTMMANAAKDPLWQAKISSEVARNPSLTSVIEEKCSRCHMGMARYQAITNGTPVSVVGNGFLSTTNYLHDAAMDGVSCTLCHQITSQNLGTYLSFTGNYFIDTSTSGSNRLIYGQYPNPFANPMIMHSNFTPVQGFHVEDPALCGSCHTLFTPTVDSIGTVIGEFPEQTSYLEWEHAVSGGGPVQTCQGCHMPVAAGAAAISNRPMWLTPRSPFEQHYFVGGNTFMLNLIKNNAAAINPTATAAQFDATIARTNTVLQTQASNLTVVSSSLGGGLIDFTVNVRNTAGHKLPSGIPCRRTWLHVTVQDRRGVIVFESGRPNADGSIAGNAADLNPSTYEPHYDLITAPDQVQIYEPVMLDSDGAVTYTLLRAAAYVKDNRLLPTGFEKPTASPDVAVHGAAETDPNFLGGGDLVSYRASVNENMKPFTVTARLMYQSVSYRFVQDLFQSSTPEITNFTNYYNSASKTPSAISTVQAWIQ